MPWTAKNASAAVAFGASAAAWRTQKSARSAAIGIDVRSRPMQVAFAPSDSCFAWRSSASTRGATL